MDCDAAGCGKLADCFRLSRFESRNNALHGWSTPLRHLRRHCTFARIRRLVGDVVGAGGVAAGVAGDRAAAAAAGDAPVPAVGAHRGQMASA